MMLRMIVADNDGNGDGDGDDDQYFLYSKHLKIFNVHYWTKTNY